MTLFVLWDYIFGRKKEGKVITRKVDKTYRVLLVGASGAGKTAITKRIAKLNYEEENYPSTGPYHARIYENRDNLALAFDIIDIPGRKEYRDTAFRYIDGSSVVILAYDVTNDDAFVDDVMYWAAKIHESNAASYVLLANKVDLVNERKIATDYGMSWAKKMLFTYTECSAKSDIGIEELLDLVIYKCLSSSSFTPIAPPRYTSKDEYFESNYHLPFEDLAIY